MEKSDAVDALAALAQDTRLDIFRTLVEYQPAGLPAGKIGEMLELPGATLSFHLNQLKQARLITSIRNWRYRRTIKTTKGRAGEALCRRARQCSWVQA